MLGAEAERSPGGQFETHSCTGTSHKSKLSAWSVDLAGGV